jgi:putative addiction module killer protein
MKELRFYRLDNGKEPFKLWIEALRDAVGVAQINNRIRRLGLGQRGDYKRVGKGVFELRIHYGPGYRVYFAEPGQEIILLLSGGNKGSQKKDIQQAISCWQDYKEQYGK